VKNNVACDPYRGCGSCAISSFGRAVPVPIRLFPKIAFQVLMMSRSDGKPVSRMSWAELLAASDPELVEQLLSQNGDAFAVIVDRYQRLVFSVAVRIVKDEAEAEEVVQTVFLDIFRDVGKFDPSRGTLKVWLLQYAYSRSMTRRHHLERRQFYSRVNLEDPGLSEVSARPGSRNALLPGETARLVEEALAQLNEKQREAIELIYFEGLKFTEAVQKTGETLPQLRHHYYRGLAKIRDFIESTNLPDGRESSAKATGLRLEVANVKPRAV
jgi:RNA polymerase sigma-70 factor, ECF subfamily